MADPRIIVVARGRDRQRIVLRPPNGRTATETEGYCEQSCCCNPF